MDRGNSAYDESLTETVREFVADHLGLSFQPERSADLWRGIASACPELGFKGSDSCVRGLLSQPLSREHAEILASHLTVGETHFFREPESYEILEAQVLPELIRSRTEGNRQLRIWSAGCATGEEPYSVAMLVDHKFPQLHEWHVSILGTDINTRFLHKAAAGLYSEWSFRQTPSWVKQRYFTQTAPGKYQLSERIRAQVSFTYLNLAEDSYPAVLNQTNAIDLLFCRNVLMYFTPVVAQRVLSNFDLALVEGGWLSLSPCDLMHVRNHPQLAPGPSLAFLRKTSTVRSDTRPPESTSPAPPTPARRPNEARNRNSPGPRSRPGRALRPKAPAQLESTTLQQAVDLTRAGRYAESADLLRRRLMNGPHDSAAIELMARNCANLGQLDEALAWCARGLEHSKVNPGLYLLQAGILSEQDQKAEALAALQKVLYLDPQHLLAHFALGNLYHQQGRHAEANRHFGRALALLDQHSRDDIVPGSEGISAGRLREIITSTMKAEMP